MRITVARGTFGHGFSTPVVVGRVVNEVQGYVKTALSGSGVAFVAWPEARWMIATSRGGHFNVRPLGLPRYGELARLTYGVDGPVDVFWYRLAPNGEHVVGFYCTRLRANGTLGPTFSVFHHNYPDPCRLPGTHGLYEKVPAPSPVAPAGFSLTPSFMVTRTNGHGAALSIWDVSNQGYTYGMFAETFRR